MVEEISAMISMRFASIGPVVKRGSVCIFLCVLLFTGCSSVRGPKISSSTLYQIKERETTKQDVVSLLGKPMDIERTENNEESYLYERVLSKANVPGYCMIPLFQLFFPECYKDHGTNEVSRLTIVFNKAGIVKKRNLDELMFHGPYYQNDAAARDAATQAAVAGSVHQMQQQNSYHYNSGGAYGH